jgi:hypothetical protein
MPDISVRTVAVYGLDIALLLALIACGGSGEVVEEATPTTESPTPVPAWTPLYDGRGSLINPTPDPEVIADQAKPRYEGPMGDFLVTPDAAAQAPPCGPPFSPAEPSHAAQSELYLSGLELVAAGQCADGTVVSIQFIGPESPTTVGTRYFVGPANVPYNAPLDRLKLLTITGKSAIAQLAMPSYTHTFRMAVIQRVPEGDHPGIMLFIEDSFLDLEEASALAERLIESE